MQRSSWQSLLLLVATLWVGSLWTVGYVVAPTLFATLAERSLAGTIAGALFRVEAWLSLACAGMILLLVLTRRGVGRHDASNGFGNEISSEPGGKLAGKSGSKSSSEVSNREDNGVGSKAGNDTGNEVRNSAADRQRTILLRIVLTMTACTLIGYFGLQPIMASLREAGNVSGGMTADIRRTFGLLHGVAAIVFFIQSLLGVSLMLKLKQSLTIPIA